jgi:type 1 glutamine amidotransferase/HEAT repeat protein
MRRQFCLKPLVEAAVLVGLALGLGPSRLPAAEPLLRVLLLTGQNNHDWAQTTPKLKAILAASGRFTVELTNRPDLCNANTFSRYDVLVSDWNNWGDAKIKEWPAQTREDFLSFIRKGGGLVAVHAGGASFFDWPDYQKVTGGSWGKNTGHGAIHSFEVKPVDPEHPVTRGLKPFRTADELWHRTAKEPGARVLATAFSATERGGSGQDEPVLFVTEFGRGRGVTLLLGHQASAMEAAGFQALLLRAAEWAATGKVTIGAVAGPSAADIESALNLAKAYRFGNNRAPLVAVEKLVNVAADDPAARQKLASALANALGSEATLEAKQFFCRQLSLIGSAAEVATLAKLVPDPELSYFARLALERIPGEESLAALQTALTASSGQIRLGVINSLAVRRSNNVVPALAKLTEGTDAETAGAALRALGEVGGARAAEALLAAERGLPTGLKSQAGSALLRCAEQLLAAGQGKVAAPLLERLTAPEQPAQLRLAAFPLFVSSLGEKGADLVLAALAGENKAMQAAAIRALRGLRDAAVVRVVAERLDSLAVESQAPVVALLGERGDAAALPAVTKAASSKEPAVRRAALVALGSLGNASTVPILTGFLETADNEEKKLVADSLLCLRGDGVDEALIVELKKGAPVAQRGLIRVLAAREAKAAVPALVAATSSQDAQVRREAVAGLEKMGDTSACGALIKMLEETRDTGPVESALAVICRREGSVQPILQALPDAGPPKRVLLLGVLGAVGGPPALEAVRSATRSEEPQTRTAAVRALAEWPEPAPLGDLAALASATQDAKLKALALRGVARLAPLAKDRPVDQVVELVTSALPGAEVGSQKALLGALGQLPSMSALKAATAQLKDPNLADEASMAVLKIVEAIGQAHRAEAKAALEQVAANCKNPALTEQAATASLKYGELQNLSLGATATNLDGLVPDGQGGGPQMAIDGNPATYWDETDNQKLYILRVQLKQRSRIVFLRILGFQQHNYAPKDFEVLCDDKLVKKVQGAQYKSNWLTVDLPPTDATAIELRITGCHGASPAIRELEIYGKPSQ